MAGLYGGPCARRLFIRAPNPPALSPDLSLSQCHKIVVVSILPQKGAPSTPDPGPQSSPGLCSAGACGLTDRLPQVRHEVSGQEAYQDEAGGDPGPQRAHNAVTRQHRGELGAVAGWGGWPLEQPRAPEPWAASPDLPPPLPRTARSSSACHTPSTRQTSSASSSIS